MIKLPENFYGFQIQAEKPLWINYKLYANNVYTVNDSSNCCLKNQVLFGE